MNYMYLQRVPLHQTLTLTNEGLDGLRTRLNQLVKDRKNLYRQLKADDGSKSIDKLLALEKIYTLERAEKELNKIIDVLDYAKAIIKPRKPQRIDVGSCVELIQDGKRVTYTIVCPLEVDLEQNKISNESPLGQALVGKKNGEHLELTNRKGQKSHVEILKIS